MAALPNKLLWLAILVVLVGLQMMKQLSPNPLPLAVELPEDDSPSDSIIPSSKSFLAPKDDDDNPPLCTDDQMTRGRWLPITLEQPPYIPLSPRVRCMRSVDFYKPFATHQWKPSDSCSLAPWNAPQFTRLLDNQTIAFVGDSLTLEHFASLVHLLGDRARLPPKAVQHKRIKRIICHNDTAAADQNNPEQHCVQTVFKTDFPLHKISEEVETSRPSVLVLNRGAHYIPDEELLTSLREHTLPALLQWNRQCIRAVCLLVWRTTVPGHPNCQNFTQPATSVAEMQAYIERASTKDANGAYRKGEYHWQDFQRQNQRVRSLLVDEWKPLLPRISIRIMNSYFPNVLRPDNHRVHMGDCLHSCSPGGGSDLNSQWLLHIVLDWKQEGTATTAS